MVRPASLVAVMSWIMYIRLLIRKEFVLHHAHWFVKFTLLVLKFRLMICRALVVERGEAALVDNQLSNSARIPMFEQNDIWFQQLLSETSILIRREQNKAINHDNRDNHCGYL